jgi:thioredoxin-like negative regulator of GroEL
MLQEVTDANFYKAISGDVSLLLFYEPKTAYSQLMQGVVKKFGSKHPQIKLLQLNVSTNPDVISELGIKYFPTVLFFKDGKATTAKHTGITNPQGLSSIYRRLFEKEAMQPYHEVRWWLKDSYQ